MVDYNVVFMFVSQSIILPIRHAKLVENTRQELCLENLVFVLLPVDIVETVNKLSLQNSLIACFVKNFD